MQPLMTLRIVRRVVDAPDIVVLELAEPSNAELPAFSAGSHIDVEVMPGLTRQYSLCNNPTDRTRYVIGVLRDPASRGGSAAIHAMREGQDLRVSAPKNHFELEGTASRTLLFAGGIGVTPLLCMAERLSAEGADFEMHYGARSRRRCAFYERIVASAFSDRVHFHFDDADEFQKLDIDAVLGQAEPDTHVYVCGPAAFIEFVLSAGTAHGYEDRQLHREYFSVDIQAEVADGESFQVKLASTGKVYNVPADRSVMEVLREGGLALPASCEQGVCGTCLIKVLEGVPDHRDYYLTGAERAANDQFTPCCSRSKTALLVIDL